MHLVKTLCSSFLVSSKVDIHKFEKKLGRVHMDRHGEAYGLELTPDLVNGAKIMRLSCRKEEKLVE